VTTFILLYHKIEVPIIAKSVFNLVYVVITIKVIWCNWGFSHSEWCSNKIS